MNSGAWKSWSRARWNYELFRHYFAVEAGQAQPVLRLSIGPDDLARVAGDPSRPEAVQEAFEAAMAAGCSRLQLERRLSLEVHDEWVRRPGESSVPPYVADLLYTCYAAALVNEELLDVGDFRKRLKLLLKHDPLLPDYPLSELGRLWERFRDWLKREHAKGAPLRPLVLPPPGGETRIGYSKRLVFPLRRDRKVLVDLLARERVGREPPVHDVLKLLVQAGDRFTRAFQNVVGAARAAFLESRNEPDVEVLWSAVREAAALADSQVSTSSIRYRLFAVLDEEFRGELLLMCTGKPRHLAAGLDVHSTDVHFGGCDHIVSRTSGSPSGIQGAVHLLLAQVLDGKLTGWEHSVPGRLVKDGVLLFTSSEGGVRELVATRPNDERVWALVADRWIRDVLDLFPDTERPSPQVSRYRGWQEVGPFDGAHLAQIDRRPRSPLAQLRCLQPTQVGAQLHLSGGVRVDGGFLALRGVLPAVRVGASGRSVDRVVAYSIRANEAAEVRTELMATLSVAADDATLFRFPRESGHGWEGRFNIVAYHGDDVVADRQLTLHARAIRQPFLTVTEPGRWWVESADRDVVAGNDPASERPWDADDEAPNRVPNAGVRSARAAMISRPNIGGANADVPVADARRIEENEGVDRFVEWAAGLATARRGLSETELLEMTDVCFGESEWSVRWDVLRAWAEIGAFDPMVDRTWRGRTWYARAPRLVMIQAKPEVVVGLVGLAGWATRARVAQVLAAHDGREMESRTVARAVAPVSRWVLPDIATAMRAADSLELGSIRWLRGPSAIATSVMRVRESTAGEQPSSGELLRSWDWKLGQFSLRPAPSMLEVTVEQRRRRNGPDFFLVRTANETWWTHSRNWALLVAHAVAGLRPFGASDENWLLRDVNGGLHLPLPVARAVALDSGVSPGPWQRRDGRLGYGYMAVDMRTRDALATALWGATRNRFDTADLSIRVRRLLHAASAVRTHGQSSPVELAPLPASLRRALMEIEDVPGVDILATRRLPLHLIPHVRNLVARAAS